MPMQGNFHAWSAISIAKCEDSSTGLQGGQHHVTSGFLLAQHRDKKGAGSAAALGSGVLYWLRQDFRVHDNPALCAAAAAARKRGGKLTLVYVHSPEEDGDDLETGDPSQKHENTNERNELNSILLACPLGRQQGA